MNKVVLLILTGAVALLTEGCSFFSDFADARRDLDKEAAKPNPAKVDTNANQAKDKEVEGEAFADLEEEVQPSLSIAGLIPATNPDARVRSSVRGRRDPFSTVTLTPRIEIEAKEEVKQTSSENNRNFNRFNNNNNQATASNSKTTASNSKATVKQQQATANNSKNSPTSVANIFEPTLAQQVVISGLYEAGGRTKLIIQAPEESTSRYVEVGQYLSNGKVLVKSVDRNHFPTPMVVLEQGGVEVSKIIGENNSADVKDKVSVTPSEQSKNETLISNVSLGLD